MRAYGWVSGPLSLSNIDRHTPLYQTIPKRTAVGTGNEAGVQIRSECECETGMLFGWQAIKLAKEDTAQLR